MMIEKGINAILNLDECIKYFNKEIENDPDLKCQLIGAIVKGINIVVKKTVKDPGFSSKNIEIKISYFLPTICLQVYNQKKEHLVYFNIQEKDSTSRKKLTPLSLINHHLQKKEPEQLIIIYLVLRVYIHKNY